MDGSVHQRAARVHHRRYREMSWLLGFGAKSRLGEIPRLLEGRMMAYAEGARELAMVRETMHENVGTSEDLSVRGDEEVAEMTPHGF